MSGETESNVSGWTTDTLKEYLVSLIRLAQSNGGWTVDTLKAYIDEKFSEMQRLLDERSRAQTTALNTALTAVDKAIDKREVDTEKRFASVNEFRQQLNDQAHTFMPRAESLSRHDRNAEALAKIESHIDTDMRALRERHESDMALINRRLDLNQGRSTGIEKSWGWLVGAAGFILAVLGILAYIAK